MEAVCKRLLVRARPGPRGTCIVTVPLCFLSQAVPQPTSTDVLPLGLWRGQDIQSEQSHKSYRPLTILLFRWQRFVGQQLPSGVLAKFGSGSQTLLGGAASGRVGNLHAEPTAHNAKYIWYKQYPQPILQTTYCASSTQSF